MSDGSNKVAAQFAGLAGPGKADTLASQVQTLFARRGGDPGAPDEALLQQLEAAVLGSDPEARRAVVIAMKRLGIPWEQIADVYIPETSRRLGDQWCDDELSFAEVTMGSARLQAMLREFGPQRSDGTRGDPMAPNALLVVPRNEDHTLGAMVLAEQLRRGGVSVRLSLGQEAAAVAALVCGKRFDAIMISASSSVRLETVCNLVKKIRASARPVPPIALGGTILDTDRDAKAITGVDHATCDVQEAIRLCALTKPFRAAGPAGMRA